MYEQDNVRIGIATTQNDLLDYNQSGQHLTLYALGTCLILGMNANHSRNENIENA